MRFLIILVLVLNSALALSQSAEFFFLDKTNHKWDDTKEGNLLEKTFRFVNTGSAPLVIQEAQVACSCTKVIYSHQPIAPNDTSEILIQFDTKQKYYYQNRTVEIVSNAKKNPKFRLKVYVIPKEDQ
ncbi:MAG: DUF1573 domain-containing protein [Crocinitomicaceae bacterium]|nr:DUF1573 domain-containing protein [Crocinitomicaceae bacterium]